MFTKNESENIAKQHVQDRNIILHRFDLFNLFIVHLSVSIIIVSMGSVVPFELSVSGWSSSHVALLFGFVILMELGRFYFARILDLKGFHLTLKVYLLGMFLVITPGIFFAMYSIRGIVLDILALLSMSLGTAVITTTLDGLFAKSSMKQEKKIAMILQTGRLLGFAMGGIMIALLFGLLGARAIFLIATFLFIITSMLSLLSITKTAARVSILKDEKRFVEIPLKNVKLPRESTSLKYLEGIKHKLEHTLQGHVKGFTMLVLFYILFGLGFFAQDSVLEVFGKEILGFGRSEIGKLTGIWGVSTLVGVIAGGMLLNKVSDRVIVCAHTIISGIGMLLISASLHFPANAFELTALGVLVMGYGGGAASTPSIARLIYYSKISKEGVTLIALFGILATLVRSLSSFMSSAILSFSTFQTLFIVETILLILAAIPYLLVDKIDFSSH